MNKTGLKLRCSFCEKEKDKLVVAEDDATSICTDCVIIILTHGKNTLHCFGCKGLSLGLKVHYSNGAQAQFRLSKSAYKDNGMVIYTPEQTTGNWKRGLTPSKVVCVKCAAVLPTWTLNLNKSLKIHHDNTEQDDGLLQESPTETHT